MPDLLTKSVADSETSKTCSLIFIENITTTKKSGLICHCGVVSLGYVARKGIAGSKGLGIILNLFFIFGFSKLVDPMLKGEHRKSDEKPWDQGVPGSWYSTLMALPAPTNLISKSRI